MASMDDILSGGELPARIMIVGYPGGAKTGALASLVNAGFKLRILDFDGNLDPLIRFSNRDKLVKNVDVIQLKGLDKVKMGSQVIEPDGVPVAFATAFKMMNRWEYKNKKGENVDLGASKDWGPDTVMVLDSMTTMGDAAMLRALKLSGRTFADTTDRIYGMAMGEQERFIKAITSDQNHFHTIVMAHLRIIGPRDVRKGDSEIQKQIKEAVAEMIDPRLYPSALGWQLPQTIAKEFPTVLLAEKKVTGKKITHHLRTVTSQELDLKFPGPSLPDDMPSIEDGALLKVFELLTPESVKLVRGE